MWEKLEYCFCKWNVLFSYSKQISITGYFRCLSELPPKNLRSKGSCLSYKTMSAFHFGTGVWFIWGIVSKLRDQTLKDYLTFLISSSFPPSVLQSAPRLAASLQTKMGAQLHSKTVLRLRYKSGCFPDCTLHTHSLVSIWICADEQMKLILLCISTATINELISVNTVV